MTQISVLLIVDNNNTQREQVKYSVYYLCSILERHNLCFLKKRRMRILSAVKSFGGKIHQNWTDVTYRMNIEKLAYV